MSRHSPREPVIVVDVDCLVFWVIVGGTALAVALDFWLGFTISG